MVTAGASFCWICGGYVFVLLFSPCPTKGVDSNYNDSADFVA